MRWGWLRRRKSRWAAIAGMLSLCALLATCWCWRVWTPGDYFLYRRLRHHSPVAQKLWRGEIRAGDRVEAIVAYSRPNFAWGIGPFLTVEYYPGGDLSPDSISLEGTSLTARDGRLIRAASYGCNFEKHYFDVSTPNDKALQEQLIRDHRERLRASGRYGEGRGLRVDLSR
jgi:hypothetical protein